MIRRRLAAVALVALAASACSPSDVDIAAVPELPAVRSEDVATLLAASTQPVVLNVWASWCIPCRSEAPLLDRASSQFSDRIQFLGLNVRDSQPGAREFIAEFLPEAPFDHLFDSAGDIPVDLGGSRAVPLTFFYAPDGALVDLHTGVLDERTLALQIDELLAR